MPLAALILSVSAAEVAVIIPTVIPGMPVRLVALPVTLPVRFPSNVVAVTTPTT